MVNHSTDQPVSPNSSPSIPLPSSITIPSTPIKQTRGSSILKSKSSRRKSSNLSIQTNTSIDESTHVKSASPLLLSSSSSSTAHSNSHRRTQSGPLTPINLSTPIPLQQTQLPVLTPLSSPTLTITSSSPIPPPPLQSNTTIPIINDDIITKLKKTYPNLSIILISILSWYCFSLSISIYNRWMFSNKNLDFKFPIIITSFHQLILFLLSILTLTIIPKFRLNYNLENNGSGNGSNLYKRLANDDSDFEEFNESDFKEDYISYKIPIIEYLCKILPCSMASACDIGLGNSAFRFISLSLYTMIKTSSLIFVLLWGVLFKLERMSLRLLSIVLIMSFGVVMMVWGQNEPNDTNQIDDSIIETDINEDIGDTSSDNNLLYGEIIPDNTNSNIIKLIKRSNLNSKNLILIGSILVLLSACMSGLRWALTQIMLKKNKRTKNPILTMMYLSPSMFIILILIGCLVEGFKQFLNSPIWLELGILKTIILIIIPGLLAFFMTLSEFVLLQYASLLTLSIAGIFKELLTILISWLLFDDVLNFINLIGLVITLSDIIWYNMYRFEQNQKEQIVQDIELSDIRK